METPPPVNLSALSAILAKSKQVMNKVEGEAPKSVKPSRNEQINENYGDNFYDETDEREPVYENYMPSTGTEEYQAPRDYTREMVENSRLPQAIKDIMIAKPIPVLTSPPSRFTAEEISKITGTPLRDNRAQEPRQRVQENIQQPTRNSEMITISKSELKDMINEGISTFFKQVYDKTLTEETIKKTINLLIKEGKIITKK